ncbi:MAG: hypothetical protein ACRD4L_11565, partial [Pyrinomonadaceae bacterium]
MIYIVTVLVIAILYGNQQTSVAGNGNARAGEKKTLKLVAEYKKNSLKDISSDGKLLLFYQTSMPIRGFTIPLDGSPGKANQLDISDDILRVVEQGSGREVGRTKVEFYPFDEQFIPGMRQVFYSEPKLSNAQGGRLYKVWDLTTGQTRTCL